MTDIQFCRAANRARQEEAALRERRAQARAALTPQPTGKSEGDLIEARMNRLRLEGTPRIKRERRQHAPPISPLAADTDFADFMIPMGENGQDFDFGTAAMKMLEGIRRNDDDEGPGVGGMQQEQQNGLERKAGEADIDPPSPTPGGDVMPGQDMILASAQRRSGTGTGTGEYHRRSKGYLARKSVEVDRARVADETADGQEVERMEFMDGDD